MSTSLHLYSIHYQDGRYGAGCRASCHCDTNGTALCSHLDGRCFCEGNYFGERCDLFCPFGFDKNMGCLKKLEVRETYKLLPFCSQFP